MKHHVVIVHHREGKTETHQRTYDVRSVLHALDSLKEELSRDEVLLRSLHTAEHAHIHLHRAAPE